jgi:hypothetical protein
MGSGPQVGLETLIDGVPSGRAVLKAKMTLASKEAVEVNAAY